MKKIFLIMVSLSLVFSIEAKKNKRLTEKDMRGYLMVYFKDETHGLYMALSEDGYTFTDINNGNPIIAGDTIALQKGIRDPHIMRGPDNAFYLAMTDLHIYARKEGIRNTDWERDGEEYGWGNNRSIILMKSYDLIKWTISNFRMDIAFPELKDIGCVWAPETIYDEEAGKLMVYYTMRLKNELNRLYYSYVDDDFTRLVTAPRLLFEYPKNVSYIDADITKVDDKFHMFYTPHDGGAGVKQAVSDQINRGYIYDPEWYDLEKRACEAPNVWKRIGEDKWVLMYDVYSLKPNNMGFCETTDFKHFKNLGYFNSGVMKTTNFTSPKHGAIIHLTEKEAKKLKEYWKQ